MPDRITEIARDLRKNQTMSEALLWEALRGRKLAGKKFLRQHPIRFELDGRSRFFIADFYCYEEKLVVEVDGKIHMRQKDYDDARSAIIRNLGMKVVRFGNEEVQRDLESVLDRIRTYS